MSTVYLEVTPHDPIIARDGRPFGKDQGIRMRSLDWPYPSVLAGSLRTILGKMNGGFSDKFIEKLLEIEIAGPLPMKDKQLYLPIPKDILAKEMDEKLIAISLRPAELKTGEGCDLPKGGLIPAMLPDTIDEDFKPKKFPAFWSMRKMVAWLSNPSGFNFILCQASMRAPPRCSTAPCRRAPLTTSRRPAWMGADNASCWSGPSLDSGPVGPPAGRVHIGGTFLKFC